MSKTYKYLLFERKFTSILHTGAHYVENCNVEMVITENGAVKGVQTSKGFISCEYFVNCAGMVLKFTFLTRLSCHFHNEIFLRVSGLAN